MLPASILHELEGLKKFIATKAESRTLGGDYKSLGQFDSKHALSSGGDERTKLVPEKSQHPQETLKEKITDAKKQLGVLEKS